MQRRIAVLRPFCKSVPRKARGGAFAAAKNARVASLSVARWEPAPRRGQKAAGICRIFSGGLFGFSQMPRRTPLCTPRTFSNAVYCPAARFFPRTTRSPADILSVGLSLILCSISPEPGSAAAQQSASLCFPGVSCSAGCPREPRALHSRRCSAQSTAAVVPNPLSRPFPVRRGDCAGRSDSFPV